MGKLSRDSATGWLASFGSLDDADKAAVVRAAYDAVLAAARDDFRVVVEPDGGVVHFTRRLHEMTRGTLRGPVAYETLAAFDPSLPRQAAAAALRRFVAEMRRYWQEVPRTREVPIGTGRGSVPPMAWRRRGRWWTPRCSSAGRRARCNAGRAAGGGDAAC